MELMPFLNTLIPLASAITSFTIILMELFSEKRSNHVLFRILMLYFVCAIVNWSGLFLYFYNPALFVIINAPLMATFIMAQIFFYAFLFYLTRVEETEHFSRWHYVAPATIFFILLILVVITPFQEQYLTITGKGHYTGGSRLFFYVSNSKMAVRLLFSITYTILCFFRLHNYRKRVANYASNYEKSSLNWIRTYLFLALSLIPIPILGILLSRDAAISSYLMTLQVGILMFQYAYLAFHIVKHDYTVFNEVLDNVKIVTEQIGDFITDNSETEVSEEGSKPKKGTLTKEMFEEYLHIERPYLNPNLKLSDLTIGLQTNRTYLSSFINTEYNMNFSRLINQFRHTEFKQLSANPALKYKNEKELVELAGFGSYKNFKRFVGSECFITIKSN